MNMAVQRFVEIWGSMGRMWGISASVARVHALLLASERAFTLDEICDELQIAKSNASTCLKELRTWGVIKKNIVAGQRKEQYASESEPWTMLFRIARERKRREFDPALAAVRSSLAEATEGGDFALERLQQLESMLSTFDSIADRAMGKESTARALLQFVGSH